MSKKDTKDARTYDAIVVGGGHNGLTNGAYLAKAGLRVLILERRHVVGGAAITEELWPGFSFTTFSYALSLLRPDIIHDLDLVKHGFMPLLMSSTFAPMENGDYLLIGQDHGVNQREIARHSKHDAAHAPVARPHGRDRRLETDLGTVRLRRARQHLGEAAVAALVERPRPELAVMLAQQVVEQHEAAPLRVGPDLRADDRRRGEVPLEDVALEVVVEEVRG